MSLESRYGMWPFFGSTSALITLPRAESERLILVASFSLHHPTPVEEEAQHSATRQLHHPG